MHKEHVAKIGKVFLSVKPLNAFFNSFIFSFISEQDLLGAITYNSVLWGAGPGSVEFTYTGGHDQWGLPVLIWYIRYETGGAQNLNVYLCSIFNTKAYVKKLCGIGVGNFYIKEGSIKVRPGEDGPIGYIPLSNNSLMAKITAMRGSDSSTTGYTQISVEQ